MAYKAAFSREDVGDAKRGGPALSLSDYAAARGLQYIDHNTPAGYRAAVPCDPEFQFNVMRGLLPGGEHGILAHEAIGLPWTGASTLEAHSGDPLFQVLVTFATLVVRRNGYVADPAQLDELCTIAGALARNARDACRARLQRKPFEEPLPPPAWQMGAELPRGFAPKPHWQEWATSTAARYGLALEGTVDYHQAFPSAPVPGFAHVVMRGTLPVLGVPGRLVVHTEPGASRAAVVVPAPAGVTSASPDGDRIDTDPAVRLEVRDGLAGIYTISSYWGNAMAGDVDALLAGAAYVLRGYL